MLDLSVVEVALGFVFASFTIGGAWVASRVRVSKLQEKVGSALEGLSLMEAKIQTLQHDIGRDGIDIAHLISSVTRLENDGKEYREVLRSLNTTLGELNNTLGRMDERMKNVESYIQKN